MTSPHSLRSVAIGDLDGDGAPDLAVGGYTGNQVAVVSNVGGGAFGAPVTHSIATDSLAVAVEDLDGDEGSISSSPASTSAPTR